jgi:hypothetical protein
LKQGDGPDDHDLGADAGDDERELDQLISALELSPPADRIDLREPFLSHGADCIPPLLDLVARRSDLSSSVAAWLEVLVKRDPATRTDVVTALRRIGHGPDGSVARLALARLGASGSSTSGARSSTSGSRSAPEAAVHARVRKAAREGRTVTYGELETSRGHVGMYLLHLSQDEAAAGHPPLTSIVVSKTTGRPGDGYLPAMLEVGYARPGETMDEVWERAVGDVFKFWATQSDSGSQA